MEVSNGWTVLAQYDLGTRVTWCCIIMVIIERKGQMMGMLESSIQAILDREEKDLRYRVKSEMRKAALDAVYADADCETITSRVNALPRMVDSVKSINHADFIKYGHSVCVNGHWTNI